VIPSRSSESRSSSSPGSSSESRRTTRSRRDASQHPARNHLAGHPGDTLERRPERELTPIACSSASCRWATSTSTPPRAIDLKLHLRRRRRPGRVVAERGSRTTRRPRPASAISRRNSRRHGTRGLNALRERSASAAPDETPRDAWAGQTTEGPDQRVSDSGPVRAPNRSPSPRFAFSPSPPGGEWDFNHP
jgi:hypothetical protein